MSTLFTLIVFWTLTVQANAPEQVENVVSEGPTHSEAHQAGVALLHNKRPKMAVLEFERCISEQQPDAIDCRWEMGWALWLQGDWDGVVTQWTAVQDADPERQGLKRYLAQAKDNQGLKTLLAKGRNTAAPTYKSPVPPGTTVRLRAVGDLMIGTDFPDGYLPENHAKGIFADVSDALRDADFTFGNLEGPICDTGKTEKCKPNAPAGSCYAFRSPSSLAPRYQESGFDVMSTANNHGGDFGPACREETEAHLDKLNIAHTGRPGDIASIQINGLKIAVIGFHTARSSHFLGDHETAAALVRALGTDHDLVLVSFHGGAEGRKALHVPIGKETFYGEDRGNLREFTHTVIDAGADLVIGHGPHVLRGAEVYNERLILYSLGNFATYGRFNLSGVTGIGAIVEVTMAADGTFVHGKIIPTKQVDAGIPKMDDEGQGIDLIRMLSSEDFPSTGISVAQDGSFAAPSSPQP